MRKQLIKRLNSRKGLILNRLRNQKYKSSKHLLRDYVNLCNVEKEIEIQKAYSQHEG